MLNKYKDILAIITNNKSNAETLTCTNGMHIEGKIEYINKQSLHYPTLFISLKLIIHDQYNFQEQYSFVGF